MRSRYLTWELHRALRRRQQLALAVGIPLAIYLLNARANDEETIRNIPEPIYIMASLAGFGALMTAMPIGARIAQERAIGWNRHLRLTGLTPAIYVAVKGAVAMLSATLALAAVYLAGAVVADVSLSAGEWVAVAALQWVAVVPFAVLAVGIGYLAGADEAGTLTSGLVFGLAVAGGLIWPVEALPDAIAAVAKVLPTYWLGELGRAPLSEHASSAAAGLAVLAGWTAVFAVFAVWRFRSETERS